MDKVVELVWENGQIMLKGQSSKETNDEMVRPWLSYYVDDGLQDYCKELLPEISGVTTDGMLTEKSIVSGDRGSTCGEDVSNFHSFKVSYPKAHHGQTSDRSIGSGDSVDGFSYKQTHNSKRKIHDIEESECRSDDVETKSVGVKKPTPDRGGAGSKKRQAAEVHNLSERRRRRRIDEKMLDLQELIPNCKKADKASMLDEAIKYMMNLQLQVQIMSMGTGLYMPSMMFPVGTQHMHPAHTPLFSPMGMSTSMLDMNDGSPKCPIFPVPPMQGAHFTSSASIPANLHGLTNLPVYRHPNQELHSSVPTAPLVPLTGLPCLTSSAFKVSSHEEVPSTSPKLISEDPVTNKNSQLEC